jgi:quercetin dioxygenase-like cupin family protein
MAEPLVIAAGGGEVIGDSPDRTVLVLSDRDELHATWSRFGPGRDGAGLHIHHGHTDLFYILEGELTVKLGEDEAATATAGRLARIPPMVVHGFRNSSDAEVKYLNLHAPGCGFIGYMRGLRDQEPVAFDQHDPEGVEGILPSSEVALGGEEFVLESPGLREVLLCDIEELAISELDAEQGAPAPKPHVHPDHVETFYVLEGEVGFILGKEEVGAGAGAWIQAPAGVPHEISFAPGPARMLTMHTPAAGFGAFLRALDEGHDEPEALARSGFDQQPVR